MQKDQNPKQFAQDIKTGDAQYTTKEERRNITTTEQKATQKHHETNDKTPTRRNHKSAAKRDVSKETPKQTEEIHRKYNQIVWL